MDATSMRPVALERDPAFSLSARPRSGILAGFTLTAVVIVAATMLMIFAGTRPSAAPAVDTTGPQRITLVGSRDPARLDALANTLCVFDGTSRYGNGACSP